VTTTDRAVVLLVEDDDDNRELMAEVLVTAGHTVHAVATGQEALRTLAERSVDAVVTDLGMPGMGGLELARAAKAIAPGVPVVVVTGWTEREDVDRARGHEVDAVLLKPVDPDRLIEAVAAALAGGGRGPRP
jgi:two-component system, OmpR family, response regulator